jgi:hypothetical protein
MHKLDKYSVVPSCVYFMKCVRTGGSTRVALCILARNVRRIIDFYDSISTATAVVNWSAPLDIFFPPGGSWPAETGHCASLWSFVSIHPRQEPLSLLLSGAHISSIVLCKVTASTLETERQKGRKADEMENEQERRNCMCADWVNSWPCVIFFPSSFFFFFFFVFFRLFQRFKWEKIRYP